MAIISVIKPFVFTSENGTMSRYGVGDHEVSDYMANHGFVKHHCIQKEDQQEDNVFSIDPAKRSLNARKRRTS